MLSNRPILVLSLIVIMALITNMIIDRNTEKSPEAVIGKNDPDVYMLNAEITQFNSAGAKQHELNAVRLTHFPLTNITTFKTPNMTLFPSNIDSVPWHIQADHGRQLPKVQVREEIVELWDNVLLLKTKADGKFININTNSLTVYPERNYAETSQKVYIDDNSGRTTAAGMKAYFSEDRFIFFSHKNERVRTILLPKFKSPAT